MKKKSICILVESDLKHRNSKQDSSIIPKKLCGLVANGRKIHE